jgi:hypothetical protein
MKPFLTGNPPKKASAGNGHLPSGFLDDQLMDIPDGALHPVQVPDPGLGQHPVGYILEGPERRLGRSLNSIGVLVNT